MTQLFAVFSLSSVLAGATIAACGARPGSAGEMPPVAARPSPIDPSGAPAAGGPSRSGGLGPTMAGSGAPIDAGARNPASPGPVSMRRMPVPEFGAAAYGVVSGGNQGPRDAGTSDSYAPPLPPIPDAGVPADSRLEPRQNEAEPAQSD